jgi:hypothetical protein
MLAGHLLAQDALVQLAQPSRRVEAQLLAEVIGMSPVGVEGVGHAPSSRQRSHQHRQRTLGQRVGSGEVACRCHRIIYGPSPQERLGPIDGGGAA